MFRSLTRIPLRRCLHTTPPRPPPSQGNNFPLVFGIGAMVAAVTYMSGSSNQRIALDAHQLSVSQQLSVPPASISDAPPEILSTEMPQLQTPEPSSSLTAPPNNDDPISEDAEPEDDESSGGAFNPVTGEINWDCPCLGGMAHGPCGPQFREAFSCFVFSEKEPKGIDCVEKFKGMQDCFREHPDVYGEEIMDDDEEEGMDAPDSDGKPAESQEDAVPAGEKTLDSLPQTVS